MLELYLIFMLSVGIWSCYELMAPARRILKKTRPNDVLVRNSVIAYLVQFCIGAVFAPFMVLVILVPTLYERALHGMTSDKD
jgi:hypothetical protein